MKERIEIVCGDITQINVDAIVNSANSALAGSGGVDGAIHSAAGPELLKACCQLGRCPTGEVRLTAGFNLSARYVLHAVGPVWHGGHKGEPERLTACYRNTLTIAKQEKIKTMAFPAISCGVYGYPHQAAAEIALCECSKWLSTNSLPKKLTFVLFDQNMADIYKIVVQRLIKK